MTAIDVREANAKILYIDAPAGLAGDMLVAALTDAGAPQEHLRDAALALGLGARLSWSRVHRGSLHALAFAVEVEDTPHERTYTDICALLEGSRLSERVRAQALAVFTRLADAEAKVHGCARHEVHFHEVGALDSIIDVVLACAGFDFFGAEVVCSPLPLSRGWVDTRHGQVPLPAPATVLCLQGVPTYGLDTRHELVTPTGASLVAVHASRYAQWPTIVPAAVGLGAGTREDPDRPNVVRIIVGETSAQVTRAVWLLETNVDDVSAEIVAHAVVAALEHGALDAWSTAIGMKKGRAGLMISALVRDEQRDAVARTLLSETSAIGLRMSKVERWERPRRELLVATAFGQIAVKVADGDNLPTNVAPEFEACRLAAAERGVPLKTVYTEALSAALAALSSRS